MADVLRWLVELVSKFFGLIFVKKPIEPTPEPVPPPTPVPPIPSPPPVPPPPVLPIPPPPTPPPPPPPTRYRIMYDSTNIYDIPTNAEMVAYYVDGLYSYAESTVRARFPNAVLVGISAVGTNAGIVCDVETGDLTPNESVDWVLARRRAGVDPSVYMNLSTWQSVRNAFHARGVAEPHYWVALWNNDAAPIAGAEAHQYANPTFTGKHYDVSYVNPVWQGVG